MKLNIQVINKNLSNGQFKPYPFIENSLYVNNYNETLDSFKGRIVHQEEPIDIEPYDDVIITGDDGTVRYMMVERKSIRQETIGKDNKYYTYELELCSQIKHFEGIICPNLSITPLRTGTKRSIYDYLSRYLELYGYKRRILKTDTTSESINYSQHPTTITFTKISDDYSISTVKNVRVNLLSLTVTITGLSYTVNANRVTITITYTGTPLLPVALASVEIDYIKFENEYHYSQRVIDKFSQIEAPETQWNAPTLREVLNDLFLIGDCIPTMQNGEVDYIDLTERKNEIHDEDVNYIERSQSADDYVSEIKMNMQNVLQTSVEGVKNACTTTEYLTFDSTSYLINSENILLKTTYPILNIKHLWMGIFVPNGNDIDTRKANLIFRDLMDFNGKSYVKEFQEFSTLKVAYRTQDIPDGEESEYQNYNLYFNRNGNEISGFTKQSKSIILTDTTLTLLKNMINKSKTSSESSAPSSLRYTALNSYYTTFFKIEYETMTDQVFTASKQNAKNKRTIVDNQTNSWVDAYSQGFLEYQKANRLGNEVYVFNQRVDSITNAIKIGDFYLITEDDVTRAVIIYQTQYQIYSDHIEVNAVGTKDYILKNYWTGVNSKIRTWVNAKDEALIRHELVKYYGEISFTPHREIESVTNGYDIANLMALGIKASATNKQIQYSAVTTITESGDKKPYGLVGTTWIINDTPDIESIIPYSQFPNQSVDLKFNIISGNRRWVKIKIKNYIENSVIHYAITYIDSDSAEQFVWDSIDGWMQNQRFKQFEITYGGDDSNRDELTRLLSEFATMTDYKYKYALETISRVIGQSIVITTGFNDNYLISNIVKTSGENSITEDNIVALISQDTDVPFYFYEPHIDREQIIPNVSGIPTVPVGYTDTNGEFESLEVELFTTIEQDYTSQITEDQQKEIFMNSMIMPMIDKDRVDDVRVAIKKNFYKDNKEIFKLSTQLEVMGSNEIYTTKYLLMNNRIIQNAPTREVRYYLSNQDTDVVPREKLPNDVVMFSPTVTETKISNTCRKFKVEWPNTQALKGRILYITDHNNNIMVGMACAAKSTDPFTTQYIEFYINVLADKDTNYYDENGKIKGEI